MPTSSAATTISKGQSGGMTVGTVLRMESDDLVAFLRARFDEDERAARAATAGPWELDELEEIPDLWGQLVAGGKRVANVGNFAYQTEGGLLTLDARHIARHHPARVLAEVEAKRQIIDLYERCQPAPGEDPLTSRWGTAAQLVLRAMVTPFAGHPECHPSWPLPPQEETRS